jgi:antitoxin (DNA-binding transcriptional repressor) of toxin-antitoxin stability system
MKTASVADLRNNFATVSRWIYEGEAVTIQKRGKPFAILSPAEKKRKKPLELPDYEGRMKRIYGGRTPAGATAEELVDYLRGDY